MRLFGEEVDHSAELFSEPTGNWIGATALPNAARAEASARPKSAFSRSILLMKSKRGIPLFFGKPPDLLRANFDTGRSVDHDHGCIGDAQRGFDVANEVGVAGRVDDVDLRLVPLHGGQRGADRDARLISSGS